MNSTKQLAGLGDRVEIAGKRRQIPCAPIGHPDPRIPLGCATLEDLMAWLDASGRSQELGRVADYRERYGAVA